MRLVYTCLLGFGWGYLGHTFHWPKGAILVAIVMTAVFGYWQSQVIDDDRKA